MGGYFEWDENPLDPLDWPANEADVTGFVRTPCRTCQTFHAEGACPGPMPEPEWVEPDSAAVARTLYAAGVIAEDEVIPWILDEPESVADRAERLASRYARYDGSPR